MALAGFFFGGGGGGGRGGGGWVGVGGGGGGGWLNLLKINQAQDLWACFAFEDVLGGSWVWVSEV